MSSTGIGHRASGIGRIYALVFGLLLSGLLVPAALAQHETRYAPGKIIVRFDPQGEIEPRVMVDVVATLVGGEVGFFDEEFVPGFAVLRVEDGREQELIQRIEGLPGLLYAVRDAMAELAAQPTSEPWFSQQWQFQNTGQIVNQHSGEAGLPGSDICSVPGWAIQSDAYSTIVAVLDTGVNYFYSDLAANMWINPLDPPNGLDDDVNGYVDDTYGIRINGCDAVYPSGDPFETTSPAPHDPTYPGHHGTAVAGFVGQVGTNGVLGTGAAPTARIMALAGNDCDAFNLICGGISESTVIIGFKYAWLHGAKIVNCSWGFYSHDPALYDAFSYADVHGLLTVVCAHNHSADIDNYTLPPTQGMYPARYKFASMLVVGASDQCNRRSIWCPNPPPAPCSGLDGSNWGKVSVDIFAPGSHLRSFDGNSECRTYNITASPSYCGGTSFAAPLVSGTAALVWSLHPTWTALDVKKQIVTTATPIPCLTNLCVSGGILNAAAALGGACTHGGTCCPIPTGACCNP